MELKQLNKLLDFLSPNEVEDNLINAIAEHYIEARVDHKRGVVIFQPSSLQSDHSRLKLVQVLCFFHFTKLFYSISTIEEILLKCYCWCYCF
jgi:hypothetical protein